MYACVYICVDELCKRFKMNGVEREKRVCREKKANFLLSSWNLLFRWKPVLILYLFFCAVAVVVVAAFIHVENTSHHITFFPFTSSYGRVYIILLLILALLIWYRAHCFSFSFHFVFILQLRAFLSSHCLRSTPMLLMLLFLLVLLLLLLIHTRFIKKSASDTDHETVLYRATATIG